MNWIGGEAVVACFKVLLRFRPEALGTTGTAQNTLKPSVEYQLNYYKNKHIKIKTDENNLAGDCVY